MDAFVTALVGNAKNTPYFHLDGYMDRWWLAPHDNEDKVSARIHQILRSDTDVAMHDHPWSSISIVLDGGYWEVLPLSQDQHPARDALFHQVVWRAPGDVVQRRASDRHKILLPEGKSAWSLFIMGQWEKDWGFYDAEQGFMYWRDYLRDYTTSTSSDPAPGESARAR